MGGGEVLESGSHNELLNSPDGAYARLVLAQKLAAANEKEAALGEADNSSDEHLTLEGRTPVESLSRADSLEGDKLPKLERTTTGGASLSSQILADRKQRNVRNDKAIPYRILGRRMAIINRESWRLYIIGFIASVLSGCVYRASPGRRQALLLSPPLSILALTRQEMFNLRQRPSVSCTGEPSQISVSSTRPCYETSRTALACGFSSWRSSPRS
jgi:hypothetical protein